MNQEDTIVKTKCLIDKIKEHIEARIKNGATDTINEECNFTIGYLAAIDDVLGSEYFNRMSSITIPYMRGDSLVGHKY